MTLLCAAQHFSGSVTSLMAHLDGNQMSALEAKPTQRGCREGEERGQLSLMPTSLDEYVEEDNPVRAVDAFMDELDLSALGFAGVVPAATGLPRYYPSTLVKLYLNGYLNRVQSSRRLEREAKRNVEVMWLTGRLVTDFKTIADFRKNNGPAIQAVCAKSVEICVTSACSSTRLRRSRRQIQGRRLAWPQFHARQAQAAHGTDYRKHRTLSRYSRRGGPSRRRWSRGKN